jgi:hypothetical protein
MRLTIESTDDRVTIDGVQCRAWRVMECNGRNAFGGVVLVHRVSAPEGSDFERELTHALEAQVQPAEPAAAELDRQLGRVAGLDVDGVIVDPRMVM